ncbi:tetratricopeptide repeat protein [Treponema pedis]|uniref:Tetratricopeptide repeat protein n=1 Tax=Treponema pedis str. T A4 TaxID=1291379 RepID=S5ZNB5_9SPIR|nr:tetratricopeptide repeat protein [Treponema pedis]AGT44057.1 hypothetical protein TPE_1562 [Treponema pedis str. T A4]
MKKFCILVFFASFTVFAEDAALPDIKPDKTGSEKVEYNALKPAVSEQSPEPFYFTEFSVFVRDKAVVITWKASAEKRNVILYRSIKSFSSLISLTEAVPLANITDTGLPYIDYPAAGIPYYYAIAEENQIASGNIKFVDGKNTVSAPVEILFSGAEADRAAAYDTRPVPLPFLNPAKEEQKRILFFSSQTENLISSLTAEKRDYREFVLSSLRRDYYIFSDDKKTPEGGETMELQRILKDSFLTQKWERCEKELNAFLSIRRTSRVAARSRFYLGEVLFFQNKYEAALLKFLTAQDMYPAQSAEWAQYCLLELANSSKQRK